MKDIMIFDGHCDTITRIFDKRQSLRKNNGHIDIERINKYKNYIQMFAIWINPEYMPYKPLKQTLEIISFFNKMIKENKKYICHIRTYDQLIKARKAGKAAAILSIEGGEALEGNIENLNLLYELGVRSICLTWNNKNEIAYGIKYKSIDKGLSPFGIKLVKEMNKLNMLIDLSHISEKGFWDTINISKAPLILSHSNSFTICNNERNITDQQFKSIIINKGVVGINFNPPFLTNSGQATINDIVKHIEYFMSLGGEKNIGLGSDFDGIDKSPDKIKGVQDVYNIFNTLLSLNYTETQVENIASKNFLRIIKNIL